MVLLVFRKRKWIAGVLPSVLLWGTYLGGPLCNFRYIYPLVLMYPFYMALIHKSLCDRLGAIDKEQVI